MAQLAYGEDALDLSTVVPDPTDFFSPNWLWDLSSELLSRRPRALWVEHGVKEPETLEQHRYETLLTIGIIGPSLFEPKTVLAGQKLYYNYCILKAFLPDFTPRMGFTPGQQRNMEDRILRLERFLPVLRPIKEAALEYREQETEAALLAFHAALHQTVDRALLYEQGRRTREPFSDLWKQARKAGIGTPFAPFYNEMAGRRPYGIRHRKETTKPLSDLQRRLLIVSPTLAAKSLPAFSKRPSPQEPAPSS